MRKTCIYLCIALSYPLTILMGFLVSSGMFSIYHRLSHVLATKILFIFLSGAVIAWLPLTLFLATMTFKFSNGSDIDDVSVNGLLWHFLRRALTVPLVFGWFLGFVASIGLVLFDSDLYGVGMSFFFFAIWILTQMTVIDAINQASKIIENQTAKSK